MSQKLEFSFADTNILASRAGIDQDFLDKINQVVTDVRKVKAVHKELGVVTVNLTSPTGEVFEITIS